MTKRRAPPFSKARQRKKLSQPEIKILTPPPASGILTFPTHAEIVMSDAKPDARTLTRQTVLTALDLTPNPAQIALLDDPHRFRVVAAGRRFGKSAVGKVLVLETAINGGACWWLMPTYRMASGVWRELKLARRALEKMGIAAEITAEDKRIDFPGGGWLAIRSTHEPDHLRGAGLDFAVLDEAAFMRPEVWSEVVRPMLMDRQGGALFLSTPYGRNWFWKLYSYALGAGDWSAVQLPSSANPRLPADEIESIRLSTPAAIFQREYLAQFLEDEGAVFRHVRAAAVASADAQPEAGRVYVAGIDWGRAHDYTAIVILDSSGTMVARDHFRGMAWEAQRARLKTLYHLWKPSVLWAEENSIGSPNIEALQAEGLPVRPFKMTAASKTPLIDALALALDRGDLALIPDEEMLAELCAYSMERLPSGIYRYSAPPGLHDDWVIALALAWYGLRFGGAGISFL